MGIIDHRKIREVTVFFDEYLSTASQLDQLANTYNSNCEVYAELLESLESQRIEAQSAVKDSEDLLNSIKKTPHQFSAEIKELRAEAKKFKVSSNNYKRVKTNIKRGAAGIGIAAAGGIVLTICTGLKDVIGGILQDKKQSAKGKLIMLGVIALALCIPVIIIMLLVKHKIKKLQSKIETITKENARVVSSQEACRQHTQKLSIRTAALRQRTASLTSLKGRSFEALGEQEQYGLMELVRETRALAKSINEVPEWL